MHRLARSIFLSATILVSLSAPAQADNFQPFPNDGTHNSAAIAAAIAKVPLGAGVVYDPLGQSNDIQVWNFSTQVYTGAFNVSSTLDRIRKGDWMSDHTNDGGIFNLTSAESQVLHIPIMPNGYYMEFVVWPSMNLVAGTYNPSNDPYPGVTFPGPMRILLGASGEVYFTGDHYGSQGLAADPVNPVRGDFNQDGRVNAADVTVMVGALSDLPSYQTAHGLTDTQRFLLVADVNRDGKVNNADLQQLLDILKSGGGSADSVPEPSTFVLGVLALGTFLVGFRRSIAHS